MAGRSKLIPRDADPLDALPKGEAAKRPLRKINPGPPAIPPRRPVRSLLSAGYLNPALFDIVDIKPDSDDFFGRNVLWNITFKKLL